MRPSHSGAYPIRGDAGERRNSSFGGLLTAWIDSEMSLSNIILVFAGTPGDFISPESKITSPSPCTKHIFLISCSSIIASFKRQTMAAEMSLSAITSYSSQKR